MRRLFISQPMNGKTNEEIKEERENIISFVKDRLGNNLELIDSFFENAPHDAQPLWFLGKSFELLSKADIVVFAKGWENYRGCKMEMKAVEEYLPNAIIFNMNEIL